MVWFPPNLDFKGVGSLAVWIDNFCPPLYRHPLRRHPDFVADQHGTWAAAGRLSWISGGLGLFRQEPPGNDSLSKRIECSLA
jgi:hypothetical protein